VRRQARGERRISEILDAALSLFAEVGYAASSTNAIAARAGISPGSLYQFFTNRQAIAEALAARLVETTRVAHEAAFADRPASSLPLEELVNRLVDPLVEVTVRNPGAKSLFGNTDMPPQLAERTRAVHAAVIARVAEAIRPRSPARSAAEVDRAATVAVQIVVGMMPLLVAPEIESDERAALTRELKRAVVAYLAPYDGGPVQDSSGA
jgi:AcrR family transcriptional regulator